VTLPGIDNVSPLISAAVRTLLQDVLRTNARIGRDRVVRLAAARGIDADMLEAAFGDALAALLGQAAEIQPVDPAGVVISGFRARSCPTGEGVWEFQLGGLGGQAFRFEGDYTDAATAARRAAAEAGFAYVYLCP
jgi:hypothetical protein